MVSGQQQSGWFKQAGIIVWWITITAGFVSILPIYGEWAVPVLRFFIIPILLLASIIHLTKPWTNRRFGILLILLILIFIILNWLSIFGVLNLNLNLNLNLRLIIENVTCSRAEESDSCFQSRTKRIREEFKPFYFSDISTEEIQNKWCSSLLGRSISSVPKVAVFEIWRDTSSPRDWSKMYVSFKAKPSTNDWELFTLKVDDLEHGEKLESEGNQIDHNGIFERENITLAPGTLGFQVVVCGNPRNSKAAPFYKNLDLFEITVK